ncbi:MAG: thioredoxin family protein [Caldilineaceae bacterium]|nr:thioredoxin family protein [Caldilineaceae bacterium]
MALLNDQIRDQVRNEFDALTGEVKLVLFTQKMECQYCSETRELAEELAGLTDKIAIEIFDFEDDKEAVETYNIDKIPAMAIVKGGDEPQDYGIRLYGIPSGYEFSTLLEDILMVSSGDSGLSDQTKTELAELTTPLHLQVFVTPTCPYCPRAVRLAHMMAMESHLVTGDMVEAIEFPHLSNKYNVMGVPRTVINEHAYLEGAAPEAMLMAKVREAIAV